MDKKNFGDDLIKCLQDENTECILLTRTNFSEAGLGLIESTIELVVNMERENREKNGYHCHIMSKRSKKDEQNEQ